MSNFRRNLQRFQLPFNRLVVTQSSTRLPLDRLGEDGAIGRRDAARRGGLVLDAKHCKRRRTRVADGTLACGSDAHDRALFHGDVRSVDLILALSRKEEIQLLMFLVRVVETALCSGREHLK